MPIVTFPKVPICSVKSAPKTREKTFKSYAKNAQPMLDFQLMVENKLNTVMKDLINIKHELHVL